MDENRIEVINFPDVKVSVLRESSSETYLALQPPDALPYVVAPVGADINDIVAFVHQRLDALSDLRADMLKHFKKTKSLKCHFRTGDVACLLGRPFMLRVYPLFSAKKAKTSSRSRANVQAVMRSEYSVIDLHVAQVGDYDQGRAAFMSYAQPVFLRNIESLLGQCMERVFPEAAVPAKVKCRPMRDAWVRINEAQDTVWFSENLIPYPALAVVYAYLAEAVKYLAPEADEEGRRALIETGVPNWREMKALLADPHNRYAL